MEVYRYLDESNVGSFFAEALTADVESVLSDEAGFVCADTAVKLSNVSMKTFFHLSPTSPTRPRHRIAS